MHGIPGRGTGECGDFEAGDFEAGTSSACSEKVIDERWEGPGHGNCCGLGQEVGVLFSGRQKV